MENSKFQTRIGLSFGIILALCCGLVWIVTTTNASAVSALRSTDFANGAPDVQSVVDMLNASVMLVWIVFACTVAAAIALSVFLSGSISKRLKFFAVALAGIANTGNIYLDDAAYKTTKVLNKRRDEIGEISRAFGDLLAMLRTKIRSLNAVADGDLTTDIPRCSPQDSIGSALAGMVKSLNGMVREIHLSSNQVYTVSYQLSGNSDALTRGTAQQADSIGNLSVEIGRIAGQTTKNARTAKEAASLTQSIKKRAELGREQMKEMINAVNAINDASDAIGKVMNVIESIAFQTNMLALNASVEAARAGASGKGFAVVAEEVRNLAEKSQSAAKDTGSLISDSITKARLGSKIAGETANSLNEIVNGINSSTLLISEIARASDEQASAITRINMGIEEVNRVVHENSGTSSQSALASMNMNEQSNYLQKVVGRFKIKS